MKTIIKIENINISKTEINASNFRMFERIPINITVNNTDSKGVNVNAHINN
ncbi:hypothetical protein [Apibacter adventoris]|uniref:hypothetical protein n=1 Tax=Apibacter adventoris TaxID=1679466 RepID=UPI0015E28EBE|nr:hypothetical protein [Apibacter adventoris]